MEIRLIVVFRFFKIEEGGGSKSVPKLLSLFKMSRNFKNKSTPHGEALKRRFPILLKSKKEVALNLIRHCVEEWYRGLEY